MIRVVYALSALLVLAGVALVIVGFPDIHFEQGWTEVIAGSVVASAGCVIFVMGALLGRLDGLRAAVEALPRPAAAPVAAESQLLEPLPVHASPDANDRDRPVEDARPGASEPAPLEAVAADPAPERHPTPEPALAVESPPDAGIVGSPPILPPNTPDVVADPARRRPNFLASFLSRRAAQREKDMSRLFATRSGDPEAPAHPEPGGLEGFDLPRGQGEALRPTYVEAADLSDPAHPLPAEPHVEPELPVADHEPIPPLQEDAGEPGGERAGEDAPPPADHPLRPTVVGRYSAGSASYIMYSNGMIEVETEDGTHRFASMAELKTFIENQEAARV